MGSVFRIVKIKKEALMPIKFVRSLLFTLVLFSKPILAQKALISGKISDASGEAIPGAFLKWGKFSTLSQNNGRYELLVEPGGYWLVVKSLGYSTDSVFLTLNANKEISRNFRLKFTQEMLRGVDVVNEGSRDKSVVELDARSLAFQTGPMSGVESLIKTLPGVVSNSELSSQYSVRGGNFDENLVYVNGIEVYRPFLARAGEQEGQSFLNPYMVANIDFSAGGFEASFGDKMSSVLDIQYRKPDSFRLQAEGSFMGGALTLEGKSPNKKWTGLTGFRYRTNQLLLGSLDTDADFRPRFWDFQTYITYTPNKNWSFSGLGSLGMNIYEVIPSNRQTDFGNISEALRLTVFFDGQERYDYSTSFAAFNATNKRSDRLQLQFNASVYQAVEQEYFDVIGAYRLGELELNLGSDDFGQVVLERGVGEFQNYARNRLDAIIFNFEHRGFLVLDKSTLSWGIKWQRDDIVDRYKEWERIDSAGYNIPHQGSISLPGVYPIVPASSLDLFEHFDSRASVQSQRLMAFVQDSRIWKLKNDARLAFTGGVRIHYWNFNGQTTISPRASLSYKPLSELDMLWRFSAGFYHQPPVYREMRNLAGSVNSNIRAQEAIHFVLANDLKIKMWDRPFRLVTEAYYKQLNHLIPYELDNVRIRYSAVNNARGFATGIDARINGEFVPGIDSWASLGIMSVQENLDGDGQGYIPRPTDRRVNFAMYFQDYFPGDKSFRMSLSLFFGTGFPFGAPQSPRHEQIFRIPNYRRVDIGFIKVFKESKTPAKWKALNAFETVWIGLEVFNLLEIRNTVSYLWVKDISTARQYAVPNYLTNRLLNVKLHFAL